jgi:L-fuculose-phosphate aldolase
MVASFGGDSVPCSRYALFGTPQLADVAVEALKGRTACLLANHGVICYAANLDKAVAAAVKLETLARQYLLVRSAGHPILLDGTEIVSVLDRYRGYGQQ